MAEDINKLLDGEEETPAEARIKELSNKVKTTASERDELAKSKSELESQKATAEKKADFYKGVSKLASKYPAASEHLDEIEAKVMAGYDAEDATVSVLAKAGKLTAPPPEKEVVAGGSSVVNVSGGSRKTIAEMTQAERREALLQAENEGGELTRALKSTSTGSL